MFSEPDSERADRDQTEHTRLLGQSAAVGVLSQLSLNPQPFNAGAVVDRQGAACLRHRYELG